MNYHIALLIGRFQPPHLGHIYLIKRALKNAQRLIIGIGSANIINDDNPLDYETRKKLIEQVIKEENIQDKVIKIVPLNDFFDDKKWLDNVKKQVGRFDLVVGNNDWTNNILSQAGYSVLSKKYYRRQIYEGWRVRKLIKERKKWQSRVPKYIYSFLNSKFEIRNSKFKNVVLGGTFDQFHRGHQSLIDTAIKYGKNITIGLTTEKLYSHKNLSSMIKDYEARKKIITDYINKKNYVNRVTIIPLNDIYGNTLTNSQIEAIVVSNQTFPNALKINQQRVKNGQKELKIILIKDVLATDGKIISSERIRMGEIDRKGCNYQLSIINNQKKYKKNYQKNFQKRELIMPESLRPVLQKPMGKIFKTVYKVIKFIKFVKPVTIIAVGDIVVESLIKREINPNISIIDFKSRRKSINIFKDLYQKDRFFDKQLLGKSFYNRPGTINLKTATSLKNKIRTVLYKDSPYKESPFMVIKGEEDLLALPAVIYAPLNSLVIYGLRDRGIVVIRVNEREKNKALRLLRQFNN